MSRNVLTLVAAGGLSEGTVETASAALGRSGAAVAAPSWLVRGTACDLGFDGLDPAAAEAAVRRALGAAPVDLAAQPRAGRRKRLLVADLESTVIRNEMIDELAELAGVRPRVAGITSRAMCGELDFASALRERVALLEGLPAGALDSSLERVEIDPGAAALVATMAAGGAMTAMVTGGFDVFAEPIRRRLGFDACRANRLELAGGRLAGRVAEPVLGAAGKVEALEDFCRRLGVRPSDAAAVGDGANDLGLLAAAGLGVAFHAKPAVDAAARFRIRHGDLRTLLYYQGYTQAELVEG